MDHRDAKAIRRPADGEREKEERKTPKALVEQPFEDWILLRS